MQRLGNGGTAKAIVRYTSLRTANIIQSGPGTTTLENTVNIDPLFVSASDAHLKPGSPAINAGDPAAGGPATDRDGKPRVSWGAGATSGPTSSRARSGGRRPSAPYAG